MKIKAISLWQPWASLVSIGAKQCETRAWPTQHRGLLAIHAAKRWTDEQEQLCFSEPFIKVLKTLNPVIAETATSQFDLPLGCIVAVVELKGCYHTEAFALGDSQISENERAFGDWSPGRFVWRLENMMRLAEPIPCVGRQGLFDVELPERNEWKLAS